ncbi:hypothetical protein [Mesorhizobium sp. M7A.F.Ca.MR.362.00.0.0]|uniref:hypothetical protein n=1 Tax=Mesorhizobium sp. M7A.F.Ca.MR.362.00.0.0 TaxID=2496779 RepID=UPI000FD4FC83|nr:hypothetical protein [Mesorhizobium sp. M7A.F.Ca.MR.362.00.0.0]RUU78236.1 hypothetical protein EOC06_20690 [Mesorhizobium sp. M7A.F.Ca.MR.362.00.0.0]RWN95426.1 MAG: hypothetical protein EOS05_11575 [Mesorhizobium sp.]
MIRISIAASALAALVSWMSPQGATSSEHLYTLEVDGTQVSAGPSCVAAWRAADGAIPAGWREIICYQVR